MCKRLRNKKVKIDYCVLKELLDFYLCSDGTSISVVYTNWYETYERTVSQTTIRKARNIIENS